MNFRDHKSTVCDWTEAPLISDRVATVFAVVAVILMGFVWAQIANNTGVSQWILSSLK